MYKHWPKSKPQCRRKKSPPPHTHTAAAAAAETERARHWSTQINITWQVTEHTNSKFGVHPRGVDIGQGFLIGCPGASFDVIGSQYFKIIVILNQAVTRLLSADVLIGSTSDFSLDRATKFTISLARATRYKLFWSWLWAVCKLVMIFICSW